MSKQKYVPTSFVAPMGPTYRKTSFEKVILKLDDIQQSMVQLQFRVSKVEEFVTGGHVMGGHVISITRILRICYSKIVELVRVS